MKQFLLVFLLSAGSCFAGTCPLTSGSPGSAIYTCTTGDQPTVQAAVDNGTIAAGDTILIPGGTDWHWTSPLLVGVGNKAGGAARVPMNIKIKGAGPATISSGTLPKIYCIPEDKMPNFIQFMVEDDNNKVAEIGNIELNGTVSGFKIEVSGVTTVRFSGNTPINGLRIHDVRFALPLYYTCDANGNAVTIIADTIVTDAVTNSGSNLLTSSHAFVAADVGRTIITTAGTSGVPNWTKIASIGSPATAITLSVNATGASTGATLTFVGPIGAGSANNCDHGWLGFSDWVEGVVDHCEVESNLKRNSTGFSSFGHSTSPNWSAGTPHGTGTNGDYSFFFPETGTIEAPSFHGIYFEDNVIHYGCGAYADTDDNHWALIQFHRHNTTWASTATHGTREAGGGGWGQRYLESYQNHLLNMGNQVTAQWKGDTGAVEPRFGEMIAYNNFTTGGPNVNIGAGTLGNWLHKPSFYTVGMIPSNSRWWHGGDGLNPWDENAKADASGVYSDTTGTHNVFATYSVTSPSSGGTDTTYFNGFDQVTNGRDVSVNGQKFSDVFGTVTFNAGTSCIGNNNVPTNSTCSEPSITTCDGVTKNASDVCLKQVTVSGTSLPNPIPANYFRGFTIRNPRLSRNNGNQSSSPQLACFAYILRNSAGTAANPNTISFILAQSNRPSNYWPMLNVSGGPLELRCVKTYFAVPGGGKLAYQIKPGSNPATLLDTNNVTPLPPPNPRFCQNLGGMYSWGNYRRSTSGAWQHEIQDEIITPTYDYALAMRSYKQYVGPPTSVVSAPGNAQGMQAIFDRGYQWNPNVTASSSDIKQRVGADWGKVYMDHGVVVADTRTSGNTFSPYYASFFLPVDAAGTGKVGLGGATYPHPLVATPAPSPPTITSASSTTFTTDAAVDCTSTPKTNCFDVTAIGNPAPSLSIASKPAFLTFTDNGGGNATLKGTPNSTDAASAPYTRTITATNNGGAGGSSVSVTQSFQLNVSSPTITLDTPKTGDTFTAPANISLTATVTGINGATVVFKDGTTTLNSTSTSPYAFAWNNVASGPYDLHAMVGSVDSNHAAITVSNPITPPPTPTPAQIIISPGGGGGGISYYVDVVSGLDTNSGSVAAPWKTIQKAMNSATTGSTVNIKGGTYSEILNLGVSGTSGNYITFQPLGYTGLAVGGGPCGASIAANGYTPCAGDSVIVDWGPGTVTIDTTPRFNINNKSYVRIQGVTFQNFTSSGAFKQGVRIDGGAHHIEILNNKFLHMKNIDAPNSSTAMLNFRIWDSNNVIVRGNEFNDIMSYVSETLTLDSTSCTTTTIESNYIHDVDSIGIDIHGGAHDAIIRANLLEYVSKKRSDGTAWYGNPSIGIYVDGGNTCTIERNVVRDSEWAFEVLSEPVLLPANKAHDIIIRDNVAYRNDQGAFSVGTWYSDTDGSSVYNISVLNNTIYSSNKGFVIRPYTSATVTWKNNILSGNSANVSNSLSWPVGTINYNLYFGDTAGPDTNKITTDPLFTSTTGNANLSLQTGSPAINAGDPSFTAGASETDFLGNPRVFSGRVDMGAYEQ